MSTPIDRPNPLLAVAKSNTVDRLKASLQELRSGWASDAIAPWPVPLATIDPNQPRREWLPEPKWMSGRVAFEILRLQTTPYDYGPPIARICQIIGDQFVQDEQGLNYVLGRLPPNLDLLANFSHGSNQWFRALGTVLHLHHGEEPFDGWEELVSDLYDWLFYCDDLRLRTHDVLTNALEVDWSVRELSLPETKQNPIWSFPDAMAWIATRDYLTLARMGGFRQPTDEDEAVVTDGVCKYNTQALGWLHTAITFAWCDCGARSDFGVDAYKHCTCISVAWEELVRFNGGLSTFTPELIFNLQEGWLSMTWPDGADNVRFLRRDILDRWPARPARPAAMREQVTVEQSTAAGEAACRKWLVAEFAADPDKRQSKRNFRNAAMTLFKGRLTERGFNLRVWPDLARDYGRDGAGAKRKS